MYIYVHVFVYIDIYGICISVYRYIYMYVSSALDQPRSLLMVLKSAFRFHAPHILPKNRISHEKSPRFYLQKGGIAY